MIINYYVYLNSHFLPSYKKGFSMYFWKIDLELRYLYLKTYSFCSSSTSLFAFFKGGKPWIWIDLFIDEARWIVGSFTLFLLFWNFKLFMFCNKVILSLRVNTFVVDFFDFDKLLAFPALIVFFFNNSKGKFSFGLTEFFFFSRKSCLNRSTSLMILTLLFRKKFKGL